MSAPCEHCPYRKDVTPYLTPQRGLELAMLTRRRDAAFHCHESTFGPRGGRRPKRLWRLCIGFAMLRAQEAGNRFVGEDEPVYQTMGAMIIAYNGGPS